MIGYIVNSCVAYDEQVISRDIVQLCNGVLKLPGNVKSVILSDHY